MQSCIHTFTLLYPISPPYGLKITLIVEGSSPESPLVRDIFIGIATNAPFLAHFGVRVDFSIIK